MELENISNSVLFAKETEIEKIIREHWITIDPYVINNDGSLNVMGNVKLSSEYLTEIPLKFNIITGDFDCSKLNIASLKNGPIEVGGNFDCSFNKLSTLEYAPKKVNGIFIFDNTLLSISTGNADCFFNEVKLLLLTDEHYIGLSNKIINHAKFLTKIFKYQRHYDVWDYDGILKTENFDFLIEDLVDGLE